MRKFYRLMNTKPEIFHVKDLGNRTAGICDDNIQVNYKHDVVSVLIHEVIHYLHDDWSESKVLREESYLINSIGERRAKNILKRFSQII